MSWYNPAVLSGAGSGDGFMPRVARIRVWNENIQHRGGDAHVELELDRPAPHDCYVQWYRWKPRAWTGRSVSDPSNNRKEVWGFRQIWPLEQWPFPLVHIAEGKTKAALGRVRQIFLPVRERTPPGVVAQVNRSPYYLAHPVNFNQDLPYNPGKPGYRRKTRGVKCVYKFGVVQRYGDGVRMHITQGIMSPETLRILRWKRTFPVGASPLFFWDFKADVS